ncbi:hypothetical protein Ait01nite_089490 [Actinoplanes italicus]|uniref:Uncharacterized protein n=1 Tax=Actinoplanes italicus TaxID=113567 RepID=A0A2T0JID5_9ACTN|nr:hypothetical protein [Actinoplanes italicus]PRX07365.1 hypothetical protein CLV67_14240 [Actinoplanes italicus]GIE35904.1 hypothetical protein Ait01nite_089490 [Actinoplanes italicus]
MPATTEPPWLNRAVGTAPKNASTSHTINFGFTSTSGSLLAVFVHGAVTNTATGWTKQAGPVATGECALLTKTSTGDTSITITHNGSDYAVNYVIYEWPAGTTLTGVDSTTGTSDALVGLSGLPGTEQVAIAAIGRVAVGSETGASATWTSPLVEDGDLFVGAAGTDGGYLTIGHEINVTAATWSPSTSISYTGTWGNSQRETISAAFNVAVAAVAHTRTVNDSAGLVDTTAPLLGRVLTDNVNPTDSQTRQHGRTVTDVTGAVDSVAQAAAYARTQNDTAGFTDPVAPTVGRVLTDGAGLTDTATPLLSALISRTINDTVGLVDTDTPLALDVAETLTDSAGLTDSVTVQVAGAGTRLADDAIGLTDSVAVALTRRQTVTDSAGLTDGVTVQLIASSMHARTITDSMGLTSAHLCQRRTRRPDTGRTARPNTGTTYRYPLVPD